MERRGYRASPFVSGNSLATESTFQGFPTLAAQYVMEMSTQSYFSLGKSEAFVLYLPLDWSCLELRTKETWWCKAHPSNSVVCMCSVYLVAGRE